MQIAPPKLQIVAMEVIRHLAYADEPTYFESKERCNLINLMVIPSSGTLKISDLDADLIDQLVQYQAEQ